MLNTALSARQTCASTATKLGRSTRRSPDGMVGAARHRTSAAAATAVLIPALSPVLDTALTPGDVGWKDIGERGGAGAEPGRTAQGGGGRVPVAEPGLAARPKPPPPRPPPPPPVPVLFTLHVGLTLPTGTGLAARLPAAELPPLAPPLAPLATRTLPTPPRCGRLGAD